MTNIEMGDKIICINPEGMEEYGLYKGGLYQANSVTSIPGQGDFIGVFVEDQGKIVIVDAPRFEKAFTVEFRVYENGDYIIKTEEWEDTDDGDAIYEDGHVTIPEQMIANMDDVIGLYLARSKTEEAIELLQEVVDEST